MKKLLLFTVLVGLSLFGLGLAQEDTSTQESTETTETTDSMGSGGVVDVIAMDPNLSTLYEAVQVAGLESTLMGEGPFTVFAPSNDAFAAAGIDLATVDPTELQTILLYHVAQGDLVSGDAAAQAAVMTLEGEELSVSTGADGALMFNEASVTMPDVVAANGVVHVIDTVLIPAQDSSMDGTEDSTEESGSEGESDSE